VASKEVSTYVDSSMYPAEPMPGTLPTVTVIQSTPDPLGSIAAAVGIYTGKVHRDKALITDDERIAAWEAMLSTTLNAALEYVEVHLMVEGVTRAFTHQMVRQRTACYAQESLRFAVKENMAEACQIPPSLAMLPTNDARVVLWNQTLISIQTAYDLLIANGIPAEDARGLLPQAVTTRLHYTSDLRNLMTEVAKRTCTQAQFEWRHYVTGLRKALSGISNVYPVLVDAKRYGPNVEVNRYEEASDTWQWEIIAQSIARPPCFRAGHCTFMAEFDRPCTIRDRVQEGKFHEIEESEYLLDPRAAWAE
jgi:flavin-dependent thymidylate synthase